MSIERSTTTDAIGAFILPLAADDDEIGGKARSLARLAALGLPVPPGFVVCAALFRALRAAGPPLPARLATADDLAALDAAREAMGATRFPAGFEEALAEALGATPNRGTFAVRSSAATEDRAGALGAGIYASALRVPRARVADAVRQVLASFLTPAAWAYAARSSPVVAPPEDSACRASVLIHPFVDGTAAGTAACSPCPAPKDNAAAADPVRIDAHVGAPTAKGRDRIEAAARGAAARFGPAEIEWVAEGDEVTFLQLRAYAPAPGSAPREPPGTDETRAAFATLLDKSAEGGGWTWDATHNPWPLSPAQAGLVALVDERCRIGIRQQVARGYLFFKKTDAPSPPPGVVDPRAAFDHLRATVEPKIESLGPDPSLRDALDLYVAAYQPLFGVVGPACIAARKALADFLARRPVDRRPDLTDLLAGVPSAAGRRRAAAAEIVAAPSARQRQAAMDGYLLAFGDESPRWDVAEPALRENPEPLLLLGATGSARLPDLDAKASAARADASAADTRHQLDPAEDAQFNSMLAAARAAIAVAEDDDALFARLQAAVRRALLGLGRRLVAAGTLGAVDDVFFLPLSLTRVLDSSNPEAQDLRRIAGAGREAFRAACLSSPLPSLRPDDGPIVRGLSGAGGRTVGRAVHHPPSTPLTTDAVLIAATLLPTELPLLSPAAIVVETGEVLGHVAAQSRERGIPAVVGATGARAAIPEGATVVVDGDRGEIIVLGQP